MKVIVVHDSSGAIKSLGIPSSHFSGLGIKPARGHDSLESSRSPTVEHAGHLSKYIGGYRIEARGDRPRLVKT